MCVIEVTATPRAEAIEIDGDKAPVPGKKIRWWVARGQHSVAATRSGYDRSVQQVDVDCAGEVGVELILKKTPMPSTVTILGDMKGGQFFVNDRAVKRGARKVLLRPAVKIDYLLEVRGKGLETWQQVLSIGPGETRKVEVKVTEARQLNPPGTDSGGASAGKVWGYMLLGSGLASMVAGSATYYVAWDRQSTLDDEFDRKYPGGVVPAGATPGQVQAEYDDRWQEDVSSLRIATFALYGVGGLAIAVSAALLVSDNDGEPRSSGVFTPMLTPSSAGLGFARTF
jgi:hypothetical protein